VPWSGELSPPRCHKTRIDTQKRDKRRKSLAFFLYFFANNTSSGDDPVTVTGSASDRYLSAEIYIDGDGAAELTMEENLWNIASADGDVTMIFDTHSQP